MKITIVGAGQVSDTLAEYLALWPLALPIMAIYFSCMGGCVGSTTGG